MLSVEIRINGSVIAVLTACNRGPVDSRGRYRYEYQGCTFPTDLNGAVTTIHGHVEHQRSDGAAVLVAALCDELADQMALEKKR